jgi:hypothetical protein
VIDEFSQRLRGTAVEFEERQAWGWRVELFQSSADGGSITQGSAAKAAESWALTA